MEKGRCFVVYKYLYYSLLFCLSVFPRTMQAQESVTMGVDELKNAFHGAVDEYVRYCDENNIVFQEKTLPSASEVQDKKFVKNQISCNILPKLCI